MSHPFARLLRRFTRALFTLEPLPFDPPSCPRGRPSLLATLFAPEPLPMDLELPRRRARWLSWLFLPERVDRDPNRPPAD
ncbi:hypothetical protein [Anaeromyxobacter diazotrophicus]|uniref:Uncharacterized protein n=1 Tax=Anaeromyxobacter diazotrophicus TaxID=2590199 RepID=A0A7I9VKB7_9BACT|nr:hypothetical protein [Anaeromyxobacter diazotrophicus]GEJ56856.1 hypothetical protein AMYX_15970 [Anaeromyxobacter diazotrophicus]